jgi:hypothetical protein
LGHLKIQLITVQTIQNNVINIKQYNIDLPSGEGSWVVVVVVVGMVVVDLVVGMVVVGQTD